MTEIVPGIYQLHIPIPNNPLGHTNAYVLRGEKNILIDTGVNTEEAFQEIKKQLDEIGLTFKDIAEILVTHAHNDHYGLAGRLRQLSQALIALHFRDKNLLEPGYINVDKLMSQLESFLLTNGVPSDEISKAAPLDMRRFTTHVLPNIALSGGEVITNGNFNLQVIWTPGHSPGHVCFYEADKKIFFSGDHVLPVITPNISLQHQPDGNPLADFIESLKKVRDLDVNLVLPAHEQVFTDLKKRVDEIIDHHNQRSQEILNAIKLEPRTAYQISGEITWMPETGGVKFMDLAPWDKRLALFETLAHLEAMRVENRVAKVAKDSVIYYQRA